MKLYCYHIPPIDYWFGALTGSQLLATVWDIYLHDWNSIADACRQISQLKTTAETAFMTISWGNRSGPLGPVMFA